MKKFVLNEQQNCIFFPATFFPYSITNNPLSLYIMYYNSDIYYFINSASINNMTFNIGNDMRVI